MTLKSVATCDTVTCSKYIFWSLFMVPGPQLPKPLKFPEQYEHFFLKKKKFGLLSSISENTSELEMGVLLFLTNPFPPYQSLLMGQLLESTKG